jgi:hypothetical protein
METILSLQLIKPVTEAITLLLGEADEGSKDK